MFSLLELTPDLVCIADRAGYFKKVNQSVIDTLEYSEEELFASPIATFIHPEDKNLTRRKRARLLQGEALVNFENRYIAKSGKVVWLHWTSIYFPDKEVVLAIAKNVTEKKKAEKEIEEKYNKFKSLATHFKSSLEKDRKYLAIELHEELAQLASVVKMDINWIQDNSPDLPDASKSRIDHALAVSDLLINAMRRISFSMSPNMLEDLGLNETLEWLCKEFAILNGIPCVFESRCDEELLSYETQLDFFRICQEALKNIMTHAEATAVKVCVELTNDKICLSVTDDGKGFELKENVDAPGLTNMRERAASINGQLDIKTEAGKGTRICITVAQ
ncbi:MAG: sensor histidine kinase [Flavisolibacter sp.]